MSPRAKLRHQVGVKENCQGECQNTVNVDAKWQWTHRPVPDGEVASGSSLGRGAEARGGSHTGLPVTLGMHGLRARI